MTEDGTYERIHLIATGGAVMHNLALALQQKGIKVSGSDDEIYEPAKSRLEKAGLLPKAEGWFPENITAELDAVIVGMHARADNPELLRAQEMGIKVFSFPEFIYEQSKDKQRIVIGGSHGKTTITSMIMHVLRFHNRTFDYAVGAQIAGFDRMVQLTQEAPIIIIEGDEYLSSPIDRRPKFHLYQHHIGVISGIAWDHVNVFPTFGQYLDQFRMFVRLTPKAGTLIYNQEDVEVSRLLKKEHFADVLMMPYSAHPYKIRNGQTFLEDNNDKEVPVQVFGEHNLQNIQAARLVCSRIGISAKQFYEAIQSFTGAAKRLELMALCDHCNVYRDFAHAPSKVKATTEALKQQFPERKLVACLELHTFSSLSKSFLAQYKGALAKADQPIVYFNPKTIEHKKLEALSEADVQDAFGEPAPMIFTDSKAMQDHLLSQNWENKNLLMMSSGNFDNIEMANLVSRIVPDSLPLK